MSSFKQIIVKAINKVSKADPSLDRPDGPTHEEAIAAFTVALLAELFPESPASKPKVKKAKKADVISATETDGVLTVAAVDSPTKEKKKRGPMSDEAKAAMAAKKAATLAAKKADSPAKAEEEKPKKSPKAKTEKVKAEKSPKVKAEKESPKKSPKVKAEKVKAEKESPKPKKVKAKKAEPAEDANLQKIDPTWRKHLKKAAGDNYKKEQEAELLSFVNSLTKNDFDAKRAEDHIKTFLGVPAAEKADSELEIVEFNDQDYYVNPETKRVYEGEGELDAETGAWTSYKPVGYVGMAAFADMKLDE